MRHAITLLGAALGLLLGGCATSYSPALDGGLTPAAQEAMKGFCLEVRPGVPGYGSWRLHRVSGIVAGQFASASTKLVAGQFASASTKLVTLDNYQDEPSRGPDRPWSGDNEGYLKLWLLSLGLLPIVVAETHELRVRIQEDGDQAAEELSLTYRQRNIVGLVAFFFVPAKAWHWERGEEDDAVFALYTLINRYVAGHPRAEPGEPQTSAVPAPAP